MDAAGLTHLCKNKVGLQPQKGTFRSRKSPAVLAPGQRSHATTGMADRIGPVVGELLVFMSAAG